jgi:hypothetical protein
MKTLFLTLKVKSGWAHVQNMCPCAAKLKILLKINYLITAHGAAHGRHMGGTWAAHGAYVWWMWRKGNSLKLCMNHLLSGT